MYAPSNRSDNARMHLCVVTSDLKVLLEHALAGGYWESSRTSATYRMNETTRELECLPYVTFPDWETARGFNGAPWTLFAMPHLKPATLRQCVRFARGTHRNMEGYVNGEGFAGSIDDVRLMRQGQPETAIAVDDVTVEMLLPVGASDWVVRVNGCCVSPTGNGRDIEGP